MDPRLFEQLKAIAEALSITYGRPPTIEKIARALAVVHEIPARRDDSDCPGRPTIGDFP